MPWDRERYRLEVLEPARQAGNVPPADLYARYGLRDDRRTGRVRRAGREGGRLLARAGEPTDATSGSPRAARGARPARARGTAHPPVALIPPREGPPGAAQRLARLAEAEAGAATHVGPATVTRLPEALAVPEAEVAGALSQAGVRVVDAFPELPAAPHPKQADLAGNVHQLGLRLSVEVVFDRPSCVVSVSWAGSGSPTAGESTRQRFAMLATARPRCRTRTRPRRPPRTSWPSSARPRASPGTSMTCCCPRWSRASGRSRGRASLS